MLARARDILVCKLYTAPFLHRQLHARLMCTCFSQWQLPDCLSYFRRLASICCAKIAQAMVTNVHIHVLVIAGPDTSKGVLISVGAAAVLAVVTFSFTGTAPTPKQASDAATKLKDLNEF